MHSAGPTPIETGDPPAGFDVLRTQLWTLDRDEFGGFGAGSAATPIGGSFVGRVAMAAASHALVVAGRHSEAGGIVLSGALGTELRTIGELEVGTDDLVVLIELVEVLGVWHLFGLDARGHTTHHTSADLAVWRRRFEIDASFPAFAVTGATAHAGGLLLAGRVVVDRAAYGWGLLAFDGEQFVARPVPVPLASQINVVGPVVNASGNLTLLLDSGSTHTVARADGMGWTLSLLTPTMVPTTAFAIDDEIWMAGHMSDHDQPTIARVGGTQRGTAGPGDCGLVRMALVVGGQVVMACDCR